MASTEHDSNNELSTTHLLIELRVELGKLSTQFFNLSERVASQAQNSDRITRLETRLEQNEKTAAMHRQIFGIVMATLTALLAIAATHIQWK